MALFREHFFFQENCKKPNFRHFFWSFYPLECCLNHLKFVKKLLLNAIWYLRLEMIAHFFHLWQTLKKVCFFWQYFAVFKSELPSEDYIIAEYRCHSHPWNFPIAFKNLIGFAFALGKCSNWYPISRVLNLHSFKGKRLVWITLSPGKWFLTLWTIQKPQRFSWAIQPCVFPISIKSLGGAFGKRKSSGSI